MMKLLAERSDVVILNPINVPENPEHLARFELNSEVQFHKNSSRMFMDMTDIVDLARVELNMQIYLMS
jgi:hypothetical protein